MVFFNGVSILLRWMEIGRKRVGSLQRGRGGGSSRERNMAWAERCRQDERILREDRKWKEGLCALRHCVDTPPRFQLLKAEAGRDCETLKNISASRAFYDTKKSSLLYQQTSDSEILFRCRRNSALAFNKGEIPVRFLFSFFSRHLNTVLVNFCFLPPVLNLSVEMLHFRTKEEKTNISVEDSLHILLAKCLFLVQCVAADTSNQCGWLKNGILNLEP